MSATSSARSLQERLCCSLCLEYFTEPVVIECGHSFCRACIVQHWEKWELMSPCPRCGEISLKRKFTPSSDLENMVQIAKRMKAESEKVEKVCGLHQEPLKHFCKSEQKLLCDTCVESNEHNATHVLVAVEEAIQDYKKELETQLQDWREKRATAISFHEKEQDKCQNFLRKVDAEKKKIMSQFEEVQQFLKQQEETMLDQLEEFVKEEQMCVAKLSGDIFLTDSMIHELEEKSRHQEKAFLQDVEKTFSRCELWGSQQPDICSELEEKLHTFSKKYIILKQTLLEFKENFPAQLEVEYVNLTLDPDTAQRRLLVSDDRKSMKWRQGKIDVIDYPQRFSSSCCVMSCEAFSSGRHYWEVKVETVGTWAIGVATETVERKKNNNQAPEEGIWAVKKTDKLRMGNRKLKCDVPKTVGVYLDYEGNRVKFFDVEKENMIGSHAASFKAEKIRPFFWFEPNDFWLVHSKMLESSTPKGNLIVFPKT